MHPTRLNWSVRFLCGIALAGFLVPAGTALAQGITRISMQGDSLLVETRGLDGQKVELLALPPYPLAQYWTARDGAVASFANHRFEVTFDPGAA